MKKIGIVTWFNGGNYGTNIQALALYEYLSKNNHCFFISYCNYKRLGSFTFKLKSLARMFLKPVLYMQRMKGAFIKGAKIKLMFSKCNIFHIKNKKLLAATDDFDVLVTGSDQIWNPYYLDDFYLLAFSKNKNKIAYSSSIGVSEIPEKYKNLYITALSEFKSIAVREKSAEVLLKDILKRNDIVTVLDPVFLISQNEWRLFYKRTSPSKETEKYILCYFIGNREEYKLYSTKIANTYGLTTFYIPSVENMGIDLPGKKITDAGLEDFLSFIDNAELVLTDSFHATALSLIFEKQFFEFVRFKNDDTKSQNSRIYDLLARYGLSYRIYEGGDSVLLSKIDYDDVNKQLQRDIEFSKQYLDTAINKVSVND